jgi:transcriptional regulator with XRE-family HTH domain
MVENDSIYETSGSEAFESRPIGEYLRRQRILRGMSAEELADLTRIPLRSLERLESGQFDGETDGFVRGFVRTVALALGLDTDDTVARMLQEPEASAWQRHGPGRSAKQAFAATIFLLLLGCALLGLRAVWGLLLGDASQPASREVIMWRDPVHSLAAATGEALDPNAEIDPRPDPASAERRAAAPAEAFESDAADLNQKQDGRREGRVGEGDDFVLVP